MFEFDAAKCRANLAKHGIDFVMAQALWRDLRRIEIRAKTTDEPRWMVVGKVAGKHWSAVVTTRGDRIRLISVRQARVEEGTLYESDEI